MQSNSLIKKYFFFILCLFLIYLGVFFYFFDIKKGISDYRLPLAVSLISFVLNIITIVGLRLKNKRKIAALIIYELLFISSLQEFSFMNIGLVYLLLSIVMLLFLDVFPSLYFLKYFNIGMTITICTFLYYPIGILLLLFFIVIVFYYEERINISQYVAGIFFTILLTLEIAYLTDYFYLVVEWVEYLDFPVFHYEYQVPIIIILGFILVYGIYNQYSTKYATEEIEIANKYSALIFYLLSWMVIYAFFMSDNYGLLIFISLPVSLIISRTI